MKIIVSRALVAFLLTTLAVEARDMGRGDGRGGYRGGQNLNRTPSMSRANNMHDAPMQANRELHPVTGQNLGHFTQQPGNAALRASQFNQSQLKNINPSNVQSALRQNGLNTSSLFNKNFYDNHNYHPPYDGHNMNWNHPAAWGAAAGWMAARWATPLYYGDAGYIEDDYDTSDQPTSTTPIVTYSPNTAPIVPLTNPDQGDWLPLGVYAVGSNENAITTTHLFLQLVLNKNGTISGTYYNNNTNQTLPVEGSVDNQSQVVTIRLSNNPLAPVIKTGLYNLTKEKTAVSVNFPDGSQQSWLLVRLQQ